MSNTILTLKSIFGNSPEVDQENLEKNCKRLQTYVFHIYERSNEL